LLKKTKRRYVAVSIDSETNVEPRQFTDAVWTAITKLYGEHGASESGLTVIEYEVDKKFAVLRVNNAAATMIRAALASITRVADKPAAVHVQVTSGTLKALREKSKIIFC
jgi:RNase P/RNase MRP subunit POP5